MPNAVLGGTQVYWREWGRGPRRAVMAHCSLAHSGAWAGVAERLSDVLFLQAFDLPGHGRSSDWDEAHDYMDQTVAAALALVGTEQIDLIGHSFGAVACLRLAVERPDLVRSLVLFEPVFFAAAAADGTDTKIPFGAFEAAMVAGNREEATRHFLGLWGSGETWQELPAAQRIYMTERIHLIPASAPALHDDRAGLLDPGRLTRIAASTLLLEGEAAPPVIAAINGSLAMRLPNAKRARISGAGHMAPITHPAEVAVAIRAHLAL